MTLSDHEKRISYSYRLASTCGSSRALRYTTTARTPRLQFLKAISLSLGAHTEAFQVTSEDDSDRDADASNHESVVNSTPPAIATSTVTAVAASNDVRGVPYRTWRQDSAGTIWAFSILLQLCGCRGVYTQWMPNLQNANSKRLAHVHVTIWTYNNIIIRLSH